LNIKNIASRFDSQNLVRVSFIALSVFSVLIVNLSHYAYAHTTVDSGTISKTIDNKYKIAFQLYPKFASAGQDTTLHFSIVDGKGSNLVGVYAALVMKEKERGTIVEQMPYRFYESSDISIPYKFHDNSNYVATLFTRISGDSKYLATPLQADFDVPVGQATTISPNELLTMVIPFTSALVGSIIFLFMKKGKKKKLEQYS
jgi:hypothetical protein